MNCPSVGVLLMAYGTSTTTEEVDVRSFLSHILGSYRGVEPTDDDVDDLRRRLVAIGHSPLRDITAGIASSLQDAMNIRAPGEFVVRTAMKHSPPYIEEAVHEMNHSGLRRAVGVALAPFSSTLSTEGYFRRVTDATAALSSSLHWQFVGQWHLNPLFTQLWQRLVAEGARETKGEPLVVFTNHSLPIGATRLDDRYATQFEGAAGQIADRCGLGHWTIAYQSAGKSGGDWLGPSLDEVLRGRSSMGCRDFLVAPIGFVMDHLEIMYDLDVEAKVNAERLGVCLDRTAMPNNDPLLVEMLADEVLKAVRS